MASAFLSWQPPARITAAINRWFDAAPGGRALWIFLVLFVAIWTSFQIVSYASIGLHFDLLEVFAWSQQFRAGLQASAARWLRGGGLVFDFPGRRLVVSPARDGQRGGRVLRDRPHCTPIYRRRQAARLVLLLLLLTPFYQFHGQRFSTNQVLLSTWPIATYCFLRSFETRLARLVGGGRCRGGARDARQILFDPAGGGIRDRGAHASATASTICARRRRGWRPWSGSSCLRRICTGSSPPAA